jgi:choline dehydrogenase-like flavoprotein
MTYEEMSPWYDKAEEFIGITGTHEGLRTAPDGKVPAADAACTSSSSSAPEETTFRIPSRMAMLDEIHQRARRVYYCGQCGRGCRTSLGLQL